MVSAAAESAKMETQCSFTPKGRHKSESCHDAHGKRYSPGTWGVRLLRLRIRERKEMNPRRAQ